MDSGSFLPGVFSLWDSSAADIPAGISFDLTAADVPGVPAAGMPAFCLDLPAEPQAAFHSLEQIQVELETSQAALEAVPARFDALLKITQAEAKGEVSYEIGTHLAVPEAEALRLLAGVKQRSLRVEGAGVSFGVERASSAELDRAVSKSESEINRLMRLVTHMAWIETRVEGVLVGRTVVSWTGDMNTAWGKAAGPDLLQLHRRALGLAIASRASLLRLLFVVGQGAVRLSALLTTPAGAVMALPVAWKFANQVLSEANQYRELSAQTGG